MIYIKEVLPNPVGRDTEGEWIKIVNTGDNSIDMSGWRVYDASGKTFSFKQGYSIAPNKEATLTYQETRIVLNNSGDTLTLENSSGKTVDTLRYTNEVGDDEVVVAKRFIKTTETVNENTVSLEELAFAGRGGTIDNAGGTPLLVAITLAIVAGVAVGFMSKLRDDGDYYSK